MECGTWGSSGTVTLGHRLSSGRSARSSHLPLRYDLIVISITVKPAASCEGGATKSGVLLHHHREMLGADGRAC